MWNVSYQLFAIIIPIILFPYLSRVLGPSGIGINSFTNSLATIFMVFGDLGVMNYGTKKIAENKNNPIERSRIFIEVSIMRLCTVLIMFTFFVFFVHHLGNYFEFYIFQGILILSSAIDFSWFFMGIENFKYISIRNLFVRAVTMLLILLLVKNPNDLGKYILIMSLSNLTANLILINKLREFIVIKKFKIYRIIYHYRMALIFFIPQISIQIYQTFYKYILGNITNVQDTGYYDNSDKLISLVITVLGSLSMVMLPYLSSKNNDKHELVNKFYNYFDVMIMFSLPMFLGLASISIRFAPWFFGDRFKIDGPLLMIESSTIFLISISLALSSYFISTDQLKEYNKAIVLGGLISLTIGVSLMINYGVIGAMWGTVITEGVITIYELYILRNQLSIFKLFKHFKEYLISSIFMFLIIFNTSKYFKFNIFLLIIYLLLGVSVYTLSLFVINRNRMLKFMDGLISYKRRRK
ncbi:MAG: oligosaccharide flippase family protein [Staphylococcus epidermidis]|nr:oligosaccharide flippase family protein [Staphylococcus epidermidis]